MLSVSIAALVLPVWYSVLNNKKKKKILAGKVNQVAQSYQLNITDSDEWDDLVLSLDKNVGKVLVFKQGKEGDSHQLIDLDKVSMCKKVNVSRNVKINKDNNLVIDKLGLELLQNGSKEDPIMLDFYNSENSFLLNIQPELVAKWHQLISERLKNRVAVS